MIEEIRGNIAPSHFAAYALETLRVDDEFVVSRGRRVGEPATVLTVTTAAQDPSAATLAQLRLAYAIRNELDGAWAARPKELVQERGRLTLVLEDPGGLLLDGLVGRPLGVEQFLRLAIGLANALGGLHKRGLIHKDIKPDNLLAQVSTGQVWLTGFGLCSRVPRERQTLQPPEVIAGTLAYMAPEQTGRMNRSVDSRADLYSCGVTLYQMLTGQLPFIASDAMEWVHCHIARRPPPPSQRREGIPQPLDAVVMKLLAKTAEERYQTAAGLEADLRLCLAAWEARGRIDEPFVPGAHDASDRLLIPEKLYGREAEIEVLMGAFEQVLTEGTAQLVLVSGYSGVGKSSAVHELHKVLVPPRGLFAAGKFDQYKRDFPYATLAQAFHGLVREILGKSDAEVDRWRDALQGALGPSAQLMIQLIPELEFVIGPQPPVPDLPPQDARNRFNRVFRRFVGVFARPERPLVLFLDDLQWLDAATLDLLEHLATEPGVRHLLLVGAYRDNEVAPTHPLLRTMQAIRKFGKSVREIVLSPLAQNDLGRFVADTLHAQQEITQPLAQLVHEKTAGNPFFAIQFVTALADEGLLAFDPAVRAWRWDIERIRAKGFTDNVVDLLVGRLDRLPGATQEVLRQFACLGSKTRTALLGTVFGLPEIDIHEALREGVRAGLVFRHDDSYAFLHDRVQEAAYSLIPESQRAAAHLRIGRALASQAGPQALQENVFEIVNQLNRGAALIDSFEERDWLAELNLLAGRRAKTSTAYASALAYLAAGRALLAEDSWERQYGLTLGFELDLAECEFLTGLLAEAEARLSLLDSRVRSLLDRAAVTQLHVTICSAQDLNQRAVDLSLKFLQLIEIDWSAHPTRDEVMQEYERIWQQLGSRPIETLSDLPSIGDPIQRATLDALTPAVPAAIFTDENLNCLILCRMVNLSLEYGNCDASCFAYVMLASVLGPYFGDAAAGFHFGKLASDMVERPGLGRYKARVSSVFAIRVNPWTKHVRTSQALTRRAFDIAQETGDLTFAAYCCACLITIMLASGNPLDEVQGEAERSLEFARKAKFGLVVDFLTGQLRLIRSLRGLTPDFPSFDDAEFDEGQFEQHLEANPDLAMATCWYWVRKLQTRFLANEHAAALSAAAKAATLLWTSASFFEVTEYHFYGALAHAAQYDAARADERLERRRAIAAHYKQLEAWAKNCPENFGNRATLVRAEIARIEGREMEAMGLYEQAIRAARENGFVHNEAVAHEVAAGFYATRGFETIARTYLQNAHSCYRRWGAEAKARQLERVHSHLGVEGPRPPVASAEMAGTPFEHLDLATLVKTSQAVSGQSGLERLLRTLMVIMLEHAGAERGLLILRRGNELRIEAEATAGQDTVKVRLRQSLVTPSDLSEPVLQYAVRTQQTVLLDDAQATNEFSVDEYFARRHCRSVLCVPLLKQAELVGLLYLENNLTPYVFTPARIALLELLAGQAALSLESASLEEKDALLKEVHHRVKNNLQLISSLLNLQAGRIADPAVAELLADSRNRIRSMALVHENLYQAGNFSRIPMASHIQSLCAHLSRAYDSASQRKELEIQVSDLHLDMNQAVTCSLIINELVSNALKHAFPDGQAGRVRIELRPLGRQRHVLVVSDDGVGLPLDLDFGRVDSLGLQLVHDLTEQLHGTVSMSRDSGTTFTITFEEAGSGEIEP
jgi:predicted ATPase/two-component sensor histidine kinase